MQIQSIRLMSTGRASFANSENLSRPSAELKISSLRTSRQSSKCALNSLKPRTHRWSTIKRSELARDSSSRKKRCLMTSTKRSKQLNAKSVASEKY